MPRVIPKKDVKSIAAKPTGTAIPLVSCKTQTTPRIPRFTDTNVHVKGLRDLVLYDFGVVASTERDGDWIIPLSNILAIQPVPHIRWAEHEHTRYSPADLRVLSKTRENG